MPTVVQVPISIKTSTKKKLPVPYFKEGNFCLYFADSIELMKSLPDNYVDMIFADPPYNLSNGGFTVHAGKMVSVDKSLWDVSRGVLYDYEFHI